MIAGLDRAANFAARSVASLSAALIMAAALVTLIDVFMRSIVGSPIFGSNDVVILLLTVGVVGCFPYALARSQHIKVDLVGRALGRRGYWFLECLAAALTLAVFIGFCLEFGARADRLGRMNAGSQLLRIPLMPFWWLLTAYLALACLAQSVVLLRNLGALVRGRAADAPAADDAS